MRLFVIVGILSAPLLGWCQGQEDAEELPKAEPYRQTIRHSFNRVGGGGGGSGSNPSASYDLSKTYDSMIKKSSADNRAGSDFGGSSRLDLGYNDDTLSRDDYYEPYASESGYGGGGGYGGYGSESGYGYSLTKYVDCNSAIAILSLILFLDILRDIVEDLTQSNNNILRKKRESTAIEQFIHDGGVEALVEGIPDVVVPLLIKLNDVLYDENLKDEDQVEKAGTGQSCVAETLCQANWDLNARYGGMGRVVGALLSNVVAKAFVGDEPLHLQRALEASKWGRRGSSCQTIYPCGRNVKNSTSGRY